jgi:hypothetical protein
MKSIVINIPSNRLELENRMDIPSKQPAQSPNLTFYQK